MALSWTEIFPDVDGEPVRASLDEVGDVATMFERMGDASQRILDEFERVTSESGTDSLEGEAADAFREIVDKVADSLGDLPGVCDDAHDALADHSLAARRPARRGGIGAGQGAHALGGPRGGRAHAVQPPVEPQPGDGRRRLAAARRQPIRPPTPTAPPPRTPPSRAGACSPRRRAPSTRRQDDLRASREEWDNLRGDEDELNDRTADRLDDISLGDLSDPSWWESILGSAFDLVMDLSGLDALIDLVAAIASGDWAAALWALRELLDRVLHGRRRRRPVHAARAARAGTRGAQDGDQHRPVRDAVAEPGDRPDDRPRRRGDGRRRPARRRRRRDHRRAGGDGGQRGDAAVGRRVGRHAAGRRRTSSRRPRPPATTCR